MKRVGIAAFWNNGRMERWKNGVLEYWSDGALEKGEDWNGTAESFIPL
jgi:hypothetical protein